MIVAIAAIPCLVFAAMVAVQRNAHEAIAHSAAVNALEQGRTAVEHLLVREQETLGRAATLAIIGGDQPEFEIDLLARPERVAARLAVTGQAPDLLAVTDAAGAVLAGRFGDGEAIAPGTTIEADSGIIALDGAVYVLAGAMLGGQRLVMGRVLDDAWLSAIGAASGVAVALIKHTASGESRCLVATLPCAAALAGVDGARDGASWRSAAGDETWFAMRGRLRNNPDIALVVARTEGDAAAPYAHLHEASTWLAAFGAACAMLGVGGFLVLGWRETARAAMRDEVTGLANRVRLKQVLAEHCAHAVEAQAPCAVLMMDLDRFKVVNDTLGHEAGDAVLREVAARLMHAVRATDLVARPGGDEFVVLAPVADARAVDVVVSKITTAFTEPLQVAGQTIDVSPSIGLALVPEDGHSARDVLRHAETAMYAAKRRHVGVMRWHAGCETNKAAELSLLGELRSALEHNQFELHFQPLLALPSRRAVAAEALLRWRHPERGLVPPQEFIPFAEASGFMRSLTRWILQRAVEAAATLAAAGFELRMGVNVTPQDLADRALPDYLRRLLSEYALKAPMLCLELTETAFMDQPENVVDVMLELRRMGIAIAVDDFGTGYSSLAYVRELPVSEIKIDRTFIASLEAGHGVCPIVAAAIDLGRRLSLDVVAEGVEDEATLRRLEQLGCDLVQGFHVCRPLPEQDFLVWVAAQDYQRATPPLALAAGA